MAPKKSSKKPIKKFAVGRPDRYSKKRSGYVAQSVRLDVADNKLIRDAAELKRMSLNHWMTTALIAAAKKELAEAQQSTE